METGLLREFEIVDVLRLVPEKYICATVSFLAPPQSFLLFPDTNCEEPNANSIAMASDRIRHVFKLPAEIRTMVYDQALANGGMWPFRVIRIALPTRDPFKDTRTDSQSQQTSTSAKLPTLSMTT